MLELHLFVNDMSDFFDSFQYYKKISFLMFLCYLQCIATEMIHL